MLTRGEDYAHQQPSLTAKKLRLLEIRAGARTLKGTPTGTWATRQAMRAGERRLAEQAEASYQQMVSDWQAAAPKKGGRERDTGARITKALKGQSHAADHEPLTSALRLVLDSRPPEA